MVQGVDFTTYKLCLNCLYNVRWKIVCRMLIVRIKKKILSCYNCTVLKALEEGEDGCRFIHEIISSLASDV